MFFVGHGAFAQDLTAALDNIINSDSLSKTSVVAVKIIDKNTKNIVYQRDSALLLKPASTMKVATSAVVLDTLGADYMLKTAIYESDGRLYLKLLGDPTFTSKDFKELFKSIEIEKYDTLIIDNTAIDNRFYDNDWMWNNLISDDNPPYSVFNLDKNTLHLKITPYKKTKTVQVACEYPVTIANELVLGKYNDIKVEHRPWQNSDAVYLSGTVMTPCVVDISVPNPEKYFLHALHQAIPNFDGKIYYGEVPCNACLLTWFETPLMEILREQNKKSNNLYAETMFKLAANRAFGKTGTIDDARKLFERFYGTNEFVVADASGLSHKNLLSCDFLCDVLYRVRNNQDFVSTLSVAGCDGTLKNRLKEVSLQGKTGTITGVSGLCGYIKASSGHEYIFTILTQNYKGIAKPAKHLEDSIVRELNKF